VDLDPNLVQTRIQHLAWIGIQLGVDPNPAIGVDPDPPFGVDPEVQLMIQIRRLYIGKKRFNIVIKRRLAQCTLHSTRMSAGILGKEFCNYCMSTKRCFVLPLLLFSLKLATTMLCQKGLSVYNVL
jgi:hypothetical protein